MLNNGSDSDDPIQFDPKAGVFWQGVLILLPVLMLAFVGLTSLRQDEHAAEQESQKQAAQAVESLARTVRSAVNDDLERFVVAQNGWMIEMRLASQPSVTAQFLTRVCKLPSRLGSELIPDSKTAIS